MMSNTYKSKYEKYKKKYIKLKKSINNSNFFNFYFIHSTNTFENLLDVLKTGSIYPGKFVHPSKRQLFGDEPSDYVYANIYFDDIKNIKYSFDYTLILHPKIMSQNGFFFNKGWQKFPYMGPDISRTDSITGKTIKYPQTGIEITSNDDISIIKQKLKKIHDFLENPSLPEILRSAPGLMHHEILFDHPIDLTNGNLIGIICNYCNSNSLYNPADKQLKLIKKVIDDKEYKNVKIYTKNSPLPTISESLKIN